LLELWQTVNGVTVNGRPYDSIRNQLCCWYSSEFLQRESFSKWFISPKRI